MFFVHERQVHTIKNNKKSLQGLVAKKVESEKYQIRMVNYTESTKARIFITPKQAVFLH